MDDTYALELDFERTKAARARRFLFAGVALLLTGILGTSILIGWLTNGGLLPIVVSASPVAVLLGAILTGWSVADLLRCRSVPAQ